MKPETALFIRARNALAREVWMKQPYPVRVALEILDPDQRFYGESQGRVAEALAEAVVEEFQTRLGVDDELRRLVEEADSHVSWCLHRHDNGEAKDDLEGWIRKVRSARKAAS